MKREKKKPGRYEYEISVSNYIKASIIEACRGIGPNRLFYYAEFNGERVLVKSTRYSRNEARAILKKFFKKDSILTKSYVIIEEKMPGGMRTCPKCGRKRVETDHVFCPFCGSFVFLTRPYNMREIPE